MTPQYTIKPLKWECQFGQYAQRWVAYIPWGMYTVARSRMETGDKWGPWLWYYADGDPVYVRIASDGMEAAERDYTAEMMSTLLNAKGEEE